MTYREIPPEPGEIPDLTLGVEGDFGDAPEDDADQDFPTEVNDDEA